MLSYPCSPVSLTFSGIVIEDAEAQGLLYPNTGSVLFEGTVGSTGISLATVGKAKWVENLYMSVINNLQYHWRSAMHRGYESCIIMPDDVAIEKVQILEKLGARVERVRPASIVDQKQVRISHDSFGLNVSLMYYGSL